MDIFAEAFTYNGDGTFTITEDALREVFYKVHLAEAVESSSLVKSDDYYQALAEYEGWEVTTVEDVEERIRLLDELDSIGINALVNRSIDKLKG